MQSLPQVGLAHATMGLLVAVIACATQWLLWPLIQPSAWFLFFPAVFFASWLGGLPAGMSATLVSTGLAWWFFIPSLPGLSKDDVQYLLSSAMFMGMGFLISTLNNNLRQACKAAAEAQGQAEDVSKRFSDLIELAPDGILVADMEGKFIGVNGVCCRMLGYTHEELISKGLAELTSQADMEWLRQCARGQGEKGVNVAEWTFLRKDGTSLRTEISVRQLGDGRWQGFVRDITMRKQAETQLRQAATVFDSTNEGIIITDANGTIIAVNRALIAMTGYAEQEIIDQTPRFQKSGSHDDAFYKSIWDALADSGQWQGEIKNRRKNGEIFPAWQNISAVKNCRGQVVNYVSVQSDISVIKDAEERMHYLAHHDALTGLPNRLLSKIMLEKSLEQAKRRNHRLALLFLDLDGFKSINDTHGHAAGDKVLQEVGARLLRCVRAEDMVARLGGDEFVVVFGEISDADDAARLAQEIVESIGKPLLFDDKEIKTCVSIGISLHPDNGDNAEELLKAADAAMYRAKENGRNTYQFYANASNACAPSAQPPNRFAMPRRRTVRVGAMVYSNLGSKVMGNVLPGTKTNTADSAQTRI